MKKDRNQIVQNIYETVQSINKYEPSTAKYDIEVRKLIMNLWEYISVDNVMQQLVRKHNCVNDYSIELMESAKDCIKAYSEEKGDFLAYFGKAFSNRLVKSKGEIISMEMHGGVKISYKMAKAIQNVLKEIGYRGGVVFDSDLGVIADLAGCKEEDIQRYFECTLSTDAEMSGEDANSSLKEMLADKGGVEENLILEESLMELVDAINAVFLKKQERQKKVLSKLITARILLELDFAKKELEYIQTLEFFDHWVYHEMINRGHVCTAREICKKVGVTHEASASRTYKKFCGELKKELEKENLITH